LEFLPKARDDGCRVIFGVVGFALLRDKLYTVISLIVLCVLLFSFIAKR
jgi:uncharacterized membrane protein